MSDTVRIGVVGLGRLGRRHAENLARRIAGATLVAAASPVAEERAWAERALNGVATYAGLTELLRHPDLDAVWLVTPTSLHADQVIEAVEAGKHVFCEKPLALDPADCDRAIAAAAGRPEQIVMVGFMRRFDPAYAEAKRLIDEGALGDIVAIRCVSEDPIDPDGFFVRFAPTSGGVFLDCCIHDIDLVRWMLDGVGFSAVAAVGSRIVTPALADCGDVDTASACVAFAGGTIADFYVTRTSHRGYEAAMTIVGSKATLEVGRAIPKLPLTLEQAGRRSVAGQGDFFERFGEAFLLEARAFVAAVRNGGPTPLGLGDAREATRLACAMRAALKVG
ncbi:myo-inositol 2-dehydrogenase/D-chiro-inositol 1-dehydrogenase [Roseiarcus fermentans]|uniref:Myo-inositol 2-dehydrogenase/D-chiro-inositol 1-dehydrogenase n=1 Tax=Roseiarcus fermentans TaxID=1473586 RepID=A0A366ETN2_9HYPH|nr:Gfo/Idh/MocA family oxidoreductase [Roseiarcus fermentans]RBP05761.1 myo-inositol 2-dehydrogenase/D-chiro-inositol 1-dehydrogenase [Roseiarcus fermentans]